MGKTTALSEHDDKLDFESEGHMTERHSNPPEDECSFRFQGDDSRAEAFLKDGFAIFPAESRPHLDRIRASIAEAAAHFLGLPPPADVDGFLNGAHTLFGVEKLNGLRMAVIQHMARTDWLRPAYFQLASHALSAIVGNELAMQRRINLSIQLPGDESSLLPVHADTWSGDSPFEVVLWVPLVDCRRTKSMFILPRPLEASTHARLASFEHQGTEALFQAIQPDLTWLDIPYGQVLLFSQNLMHGNRINLEPETRWSMNCRFKGLFTPYADKRLGEFFEPITLRPATRLGLDYRFPEGFHD